MPKIFPQILSLPKYCERGRGGREGQKIAHLLGLTYYLQLLNESQNRREAYKALTKYLVLCEFIIKCCRMLSRQVEVTLGLYRISQSLKQEHLF